jgi:hypothetical protein
MFDKKMFMGAGTGLLLALVLSGCNGGGSSSGGSNEPTPVTTDTTVTGVAMAGPFSSGQVCAYEVVGGAQGDQLACAQINPADSSFSVQVQDYEGDVILAVLAGAVYDDEATPGIDTTALTAPLRTFATVNGGQVSVALTPMTEAAIRLASGLNGAAIQAAAQQFAAAYGLTANGFDLFTTLPRATVADVLQEAYRQALAFMSGLQAASGMSLDAYLNGLNLAGLGQYAQQVQAHINAHLPSHCSFTSASLVCSMPGSGGGDNGGGDNGGGDPVPSGNYRLDVTVSTSMGGALPAVTILNIPKPDTQEQFCNNEQTLDQIEAINAANPGGTLTITGCSFNGIDGTISARIDITSPISLTINYTALYHYTAM